MMILVDLFLSLVPILPLFKKFVHASLVTCSMTTSDRIQVTRSCFLFNTQNKKFYHTNIMAVLERKYQLQFQSRSHFNGCFSCPKTENL